MDRSEYISPLHKPACLIVFIPFFVTKYACRLFPNYAKGEVMFMHLAILYAYSLMATNTQNLVTMYARDTL